ELRQKRGQIVAVRAPGAEQLNDDCLAGVAGAEERRQIQPLLGRRDAHALQRIDDVEIGGTNRGEGVARTIGANQLARDFVVSLELTMKQIRTRSIECGQPQRRTVKVSGEVAEVAVLEGHFGSAADDAVAIHLQDGFRWLARLELESPDATDVAAGRGRLRVGVARNESEGWVEAIERLRGETNPIVIAEVAAGMTPLTGQCSAVVDVRGDARAVDHEVEQHPRTQPLTLQRDALRSVQDGGPFEIAVR